MVQNVIVIFTEMSYLILLEIPSRQYISKILMVNLCVNDVPMMLLIISLKNPMSLLPYPPLSESSLSQFKEFIQHENEKRFGLLEKQLEIQSEEIRDIIKSYPKDIPPSVILTDGEYAELILKKSHTWKIESEPWWDADRIVEIKFEESTKVNSFFKEDIQFPSEAKLQIAAMAACKELGKKENKHYWSLAFSDTHSKGLAGTTRKPDICMVDRKERGVDVERPHLDYVVAFMELKLEVTDSEINGFTGMMHSMFQSDPNRVKVSGCITDSHSFTFIRLERVQVGDSQIINHYRTRKYQLEKNITMKGKGAAPNRRIISSFFFNSPWQLGLGAPTLVRLDKDKLEPEHWNRVVEHGFNKIKRNNPNFVEFNGRQFAKGGTSSVFKWRPLNDHGSNAIIVKELNRGVEVKNFEKEVESFEYLSGVPKVKPFIPEILFVYSHDGIHRIGMTPVGNPCDVTTFSLDLLRELIDYAKALIEMGRVDWDLRNSNIMLNPQGKLLKVDLGAIVKESKTIEVPYHGTDRFAHPEILEKLATRKENVPIPAIAPDYSHMLYSIAATCAYWENPSIHNTICFIDSKDPKAILKAWKSCDDPKNILAKAREYADAKQPDLLFNHLKSAYFPVSPVH